ncbi:hypothetical protein LAZ67_X002182 [Cordylochernes scorpioides]|uniref:Reverse transcriptase Ty1/copia-type domain-containing protein n=1 Tax=Cordylochernes scorpioides TaxID=51811 RepID=A0ABY6LTM6_9ARAC|nr:hypothetical protein LAZ67_X002182 [Cordylochernes scorpioides]
MMAAVRWNGSFTEIIKIQSGVLQGEPLSPYLFIIFINDLLATLDDSDLPDKSSWEIWSDKNDEAFGIIITTLTNEQAGMFIGETNAKKVWDSLRKTYTGNLEDKIIDIGLELKNFKLNDNETVDEYITKAKNIASRSSSLGHKFFLRELSFHIVRGIHPKYENIAIVSRSKREAKIEEIQQTLREEESKRNMRSNQLERCVKGGRKKGETKSILEERHKVRLEEQERKLIGEGVRGSQRIKDRNDANLIMEIDHYIPENFKEAMNSGERNEWHKAMEEELSEIEKHKVWTLVPRENGMKVINSKWVYSTKKTSNYAIYKRKARLVAVGCNQRYGVDYKESFSPVLKKESLRTIVALATQQNLIIMTYDVKTAYLYGELEETIYMNQPDGFMQKGEENKVCKLEKSLYGLPQSGKCWNKKINEILYQLGMIRTKCDSCVYKLQRGEEYAILGLYVDDLIIAGTSKEINDNLALEIEKYVTLTEKKDSEPFIGIEIKRAEDGFYLFQTHYIDTILHRFGLDECKSVQTPGDQNQNLDEYLDSKPVDKTVYQEMIGSLMYLSTGTRPDISFNVSNLSQYSNDPREIHLTGVKRIYRYLKGTGNNKSKDNNITISTDASWCTTRDAKSYSGYTVKHGNNLINWRNRKQNLVALSTCEGEPISICEGLLTFKRAIPHLVRYDGAVGGLVTLLECLVHRYGVEQHGFPGATIGRDASSDPVVLNPNIDIPKYDVKEEPRPWIESLEEIGFLYHLADYIISRYVAMNMIGSAKNWLNLHKISFTSWENF